MTLHTTISHFAEEVKSRLPGQPVYVRWRGGPVRVTCGDEKTGLRIVASATQNVLSVHRILIDAGLTVRDGEWTDGDSEASNDSLWIGAVSYTSSEAKPGLWVEAFSHAPTQAEVLQAMLTELREQGVVGDVQLERFTQLTEVNVLVLGPQDLSSMLFDRMARGIE